MAKEELSNCGLKHLRNCLSFSRRMHYCICYIGSKKIIPIIMISATNVVLATVTTLRTMMRVRIKKWMMLNLQMMTIFMRVSKDLF